MKNTWYSYIDTQSLILLKDELNGLTLRHPHSAVIKRRSDEFRSSYIYNTNAMEGNPITHNDTAYIINSRMFLESYPAMSNMEVVGSNAAWDFVLTTPPLTMETVLRIHKHILFFDVDNAGLFRKIPVYVGEKQMADADKVVVETASLFDMTEPDVFRRAALFHLRFENIHPFVDGNGRTGRMLINLHLMREGFLPVNIKHSDAGRYYRCFRQYDIASEKGVQEMYNLITKYEYEELIGLIGALS